MLHVPVMETGTELIVKVSDSQGKELTVVLVLIKQAYVNMNLTMVLIHIGKM